LKSWAADDLTAVVHRRTAVRRCIPVSFKKRLLESVKVEKKWDMLWEYRAAANVQSSGLKAVCGCLQAVLLTPGHLEQSRWPLLFNPTAMKPKRPKSLYRCKTGDHLFINEVAIISIHQIRDEKVNLRVTLPPLKVDYVPKRRPKSAAG